VKDVLDGRGNFIYRYWTGHMVLTSYLLYLFPEVRIASKFTYSLVLVLFFLYISVWREKFGNVSTIFMFFVFIGSGSLLWESFFNPTWGLGGAFLTAAAAGFQVRRGRSYIVPAVAGAVFTNWVGYDHVFDAIALSLPFFMLFQDDDCGPAGLTAPLIFVAAFLATTALMMALRAPILYFDGHDPVKFLGQVHDQTLYRLQGRLNQREHFTNAEISRAFAIREALPYLNGYLFKLGGILTPKPGSILSYLAFAMLPSIGVLGASFYQRRRFDVPAAYNLMIMLLVLFFFHFMFLFFINHAVVHPWMDCRHMLFSAAVCWGSLLGTCMNGRNGA
jgi:hypothetical protein